VVVGTPDQAAPSGAPSILGRSTRFGNVSEFGSNGMVDTVTGGSGGKGGEKGGKRGSGCLKLATYFNSSTHSSLSYTRSREVEVSLSQILLYFSCL
jgi:hypothetical protein